MPQPQPEPEPEREETNDPGSPEVRNPTGPDDTQSESKDMTVLIIVLAAAGLIAALVAAYLCKKRNEKYVEQAHTDSSGLAVGGHDYAKSLRINESINETDYDRNGSHQY